MNLYISTNLYKPEQLNHVFELLEQVQDPMLGIEIFPEWHNPVFGDMLAKYKEKFRLYPSSLHGPYEQIEHSKREGTQDYIKAAAYFRQTLRLGRSLHSKYIVYHHNNCLVDSEKREEMVQVSSKNLQTLAKEAAQYGVRIVVENAGVRSRGNMLFNEAEFIRMAEQIPEDILLDIGHAHANGWNLDHVIKSLSHKIIAYHVHNNDGEADHHNRIFDGTLDFEQFLKTYQIYTPKADIVIEYGKHCAEDKEGIIEDIAYIRKALQV